jgi:hypothetical protein
MTKDLKSWEEEFDEEFYEGLGAFAESDGEYYPQEDKVKEFISDLLQSQKQAIEESIIETIIKLSKKYWIDSEVGSPMPLIVNETQFKKFILDDLLASAPEENHG